MLYDELTRKATIDLLNFHKKWLEAKTDEEKKELLKLAENINAEYNVSTSIMDSFVNAEAGRLVDYFADTGLPILNREETLELIKKLEEYNDQQA